MTVPQVVNGLAGAFGSIVQPSELVKVLAVKLESTSTADDPAFFT
jgi:hypothetical protein